MDGTIIYSTLTKFRTVNYFQLKLTPFWGCVIYSFLLYSRLLHIALAFSRHTFLPKYHHQKVFTGLHYHCWLPVLSDHFYQEKLKANAKRHFFFLFHRQPNRSAHFSPKSKFIITGNPNRIFLCLYVFIRMYFVNLLSCLFRCLYNQLIRAFKTEIDFR